MMTPIRAEVSGWTAWRTVSVGFEERDENRCYHEAKIPPLVKKIPVDIDTVWLTEVFPNECAN